MVRAFRALRFALQSARGLICARLYADAEHPDSLCYIEEWSTAEDFDRQVVAEHYTRVLALMEDAAEAPDLRVNTVSDVKGLDHLKALRLTGDDGRLSFGGGPQP